MIEREVIKLLKSAGIGEEQIKLESPPQKEFGDLSFPCFDLAKIQKKSPQDIAVDIVDRIEMPKDSFISDIQVKGGYVNFFFNYEKFTETILKEILTKKIKYGQINIGKKKRILVEFAHPNTHKGLHIGHFRNISLGESLCRILEFTGHKVFRVNYQGDVGPHIAKALWAFINLYDCKVPEEKEKTKAE